MTMKRYIRSSLLYFLLGVGVSMAGTAACVLAAQLRPAPASEIAQEGMLKLNSRYGDPGASAEYSRRLGTRLEQLGYEETQFLSEMLIPELREVRHLQVITIDAGWPMFAFRRHEQNRPDVSVWHDLWDRTFVPQALVFRVASMNSDSIIWPTSPIWGGLLVNSLLYAIAIWCVVVGPRVIRRTMRLRRGLCPRCAYPVGVHDRCTECGEPRAIPGLR